jgi:DNA-binding NtrC family response regulator
MTILERRQDLVKEATNILVVTTDSELSKELARGLKQIMGAEVRVAVSLEHARMVLECGSIDAVVASAVVGDGEALSLISNHGDETPAPLILLDEELNAPRLLAALRMGAADVLTSPVDLERLPEVVRKAVDQRRERRRELADTERLRSANARMMRDRRDLRMRIDLVCRDIVQAYRRLAEKFVEHAQIADDCDGPSAAC